MLPVIIQTDYFLIKSDFKKLISLLRQDIVHNRAVRTGLIALMDKKILQIKFSFPIPLNAKFSVLPGSGLMRFSQYAEIKFLILGAR